MGQGRHTSIKRRVKDKVVGQGRYTSIVKRKVKHTGRGTEGWHTSIVKRVKHKVVGQRASSIRLQRGVCVCRGGGGGGGGG